IHISVYPIPYHSLSLVSLLSFPRRVAAATHGSKRWHRLVEGGSTGGSGGPWREGGAWICCGAGCGGREHRRRWQAVEGGRGSAQTVVAYGGGGSQLRLLRGVAVGGYC
ncbi:Os01g0615000, partial [Oryza sativa Japonica Group]